MVDKEYDEGLRVPNDIGIGMEPPDIQNKPLPADGGDSLIFGYGKSESGSEVDGEFNGGPDKNKPAPAKGTRFTDKVGSFNTEEA